MHVTTIHLLGFPLMACTIYYTQTTPNTKVENRAQTCISFHTVKIANIINTLTTYINAINTIDTINIDNGKSPFFVFEKKEEKSKKAAKRENASTCRASLIFD